MQTLSPQTTIAELFDTDLRFVIPPYQRAYSWKVNSGKDKQLTQFIQDLKEQPSEKPYFLGHFVFERPSPGETNSGGLLVIDGQQRLTTVIIFFSCLLRELERRGERPQAPLSLERLRARYLRGPKGSRLETVRYDQPFFSRLVLDGEQVVYEGTRSQKLIWKARHYFSEELQKAESSELVLWRKTIESAVVTTFEVPGKVEATQIFVFQNDRGIEPTNLEKLKAFLMHKVYLHSVMGSEREVIAEIEHFFEKIYNLTERIELGEDQVLNHHSTAFLRGWDPPLDNVKAELNAEPDNAAKVKWMRGFCHDLHETFQHVVDIEREAERECAFGDLLILDGPNSWPMLLKLFRWHKPEIDYPTFQRLLRLMEITLFKKAYSPGGYRSHGFHGAAKHYGGDKDALSSQLEHWAQHGFQHYWAFNQNFKMLLDGNYHFFPATRYLLWKYENRLRESHRNKAIPPSDFRNLYDEATWRSTIDHIMPQNPETVAHTQDFHDRFLNNLGNLVLMTLGKNASANNSLPTDEGKLKTLDDSTLLSHKNVAQTIRRNGRWGGEEIEARKREIVEFALERWEAHG